MPPPNTTRVLSSVNDGRKERPRHLPKLRYKGDALKTGFHLRIDVSNTTGFGMKKRETEKTRTMQTNGARRKLLEVRWPPLQATSIMRLYLATCMARQRAFGSERGRMSNENGRGRTMRRALFIATGERASLTMREGSNIAWN